MPALPSPNKLPVLTTIEYTNTSESTCRREVVSNESELLILVDSQDRELGCLDKQSCHDGVGVLHRAFSLFVFNEQGDLLIQQRAGNKRLWPLFWSNSCCSHPRKGEALANAVPRRCRQELGFTVDPTYVYKFEYQAAYKNIGTEHELCAVYLARHLGPVSVNTTEIAAWSWISPEDLSQQLEQTPEKFTPWFKLEWQRLRSEHTQMSEPYMRLSS